MTDTLLAQMTISERNEWLDRQADLNAEARAEARADRDNVDPDAWMTGQDRYEASFRN